MYIYLTVTSAIVLNRHIALINLRKSSSDRKRRAVPLRQLKARLHVHSRDRIALESSSVLSL